MFRLMAKNCTSRNRKDIQESSERHFEPKDWNNLASGRTDSDIY